MNESKLTREATGEEPALLPPVDVVEDASGITLYADLPGVAKERLSVQVDGDTLTLSGEMDIAMPEGMAATHAEVNLPRFRRSFSLSKELDPEKLSAELKNGVLRLRIGKAVHAQPRKVEIKVG
ncbi:MAG: Hsp20/alpha crystallin family protein [bacterium]|jgi:HSP20 family protein